MMPRLYQKSRRPHNVGYMLAHDSCIFNVDVTLTKYSPHALDILDFYILYETVKAH